VGEPLKAARDFARKSALLSLAAFGGSPTYIFDSFATSTAWA